MASRASSAPSIAAAPTRALFRSLSALRGKRIFHPHGVGFAATLEPRAGAATGADLFDDGERRRAIVRLSRSAGLPEALPDPCGLAFRVPDAYGPGRAQDLLLVSSAAAVGGRHLILPSRGFADRPYSCLLPYRVGEALVLLGAVAEAPSPGPKLAALRERDRGGLAFRIVISTPGGRWRAAARLTLDERLPADEVENLQLDPANTGGGLELADPVNRLRHPAYRGSQRGRNALGRREPKVAGIGEPGPPAAGRAAKSGRAARGATGLP